MKPITMYEADDGSVYRKQEDAERRDALIARCAQVVTDIGLRPTPEGTDFGNGGGFVQQPTGSRDQLLDALREMGAHRDSNGPLGMLLNRAWRIDDQDREWGQPHFALHPHKGKQVAL